MKFKQFTLLLCAIFLCIGNTFAQNEKTEESVKKVVIVKKTIDADGNKTVEETILEGEEAIDFELEEIDMSEGNRVIKIEKEIEGGKEEKQVRILKFNSDEGELTPEMIAKLKAEGIDIEKIMEEAEGGKTKIDSENKVIVINKGEKEIDVEKEIIIVNDDGKEQKTQMRIKRKMMDSTDGNTLNIKALNINLDEKELKFSASLPEAVTSFCVIDTDGKVICKEVIKKFSGKLDRTVNLEKAASGPLFMIIKQGDKVFSERIVR